MVFTKTTKLKASSSISRTIFCGSTYYTQHARVQGYSQPYHLNNETEQSAKTFRKTFWTPSSSITNGETWQKVSLLQFPLHFYKQLQARVPLIKSYKLSNAASTLRNTQCSNFAKIPNGWQVYIHYYALYYITIIQSYQGEN